MNKTWRPDGWDKTLREILDDFNVTYMNSDECKLIEAGASAMLKEVVAWLEDNKIEVITEHDRRGLRVVPDYKWQKELLGGK